jgi:hypothetical protein
LVASAAKFVPVTLETNGKLREALRLHSIPAACVATPAFGVRVFFWFAERGRTLGVVRVGALGKDWCIRIAVTAVSFAALLQSGRAHAQTAEAGSVPDAPPEESLAVVEVKRALDAARRQLESGKTDGTLKFADRSDWVRTTSGEWAEPRAERANCPAAA